MRSKRRCPRSRGLLLAQAPLTEEEAVPLATSAVGALVLHQVAVAHSAHYLPVQSLWSVEDGDRLTLGFETTHTL